MDPDWLLDQFGTAFFWVSLAIIFVECGLFFPFLPGDTCSSRWACSSPPRDLVVPGGRSSTCSSPSSCSRAAAFAGNVVGYEIGRKIGPPLYQHDGRILKREDFTKTEAFFEKHGSKALVIGRFVPFVRTYITVVAGAAKMDRRQVRGVVPGRCVIWALSIMPIGYFVGQAFPGLADNID